MCDHGGVPFGTFKRTCCKELSWLTVSPGHKFTFNCSSCQGHLPLDSCGPLTKPSSSTRADACLPVARPPLMGNLYSRTLHPRHRTFSSALKAIDLPTDQSSLAFLLSGMSSVRPQGHLYLKAPHTCLCSSASLSFSCISPPSYKLLSAS